MINRKYQEDNKRIFKNTVFMTIRLILMMFIGLYTSRIILEVLGVEDYGTYNVVAGFVIMFSIFTSFFISSCQRFLSYSIGKKDMQKLNNTFSTIQLITIMGAILLLIITLPLTNIFIEKLLVIPEERWSAARFVFICSVFTLALTVIAQPYIALITAHEQIKFFSFISIIEYILKLFAILSLKYVEFCVDNLKLYAIMLIVIALIIRISTGLYCRKHFAESSFRFIVDKSLLKKVFAFSFWTGIGSFGGIIKDQSGNVLLNIFYGVALNAAKGVSQQVLGIINQLGMNLTIPISPQITKSYAAGDIHRSIALTLLLAKIQGYVLGFFSVPLMLETDYILTLWLKNPPEYASQFVRWSLVLCVLQAVSNAYGPLYLAVGRLKKLQITTFFVNITIIPVLYIIYKMGAPAVSVLYCSILYQIITMVLFYLNLSTYVDFPVRKFYFDVVFKLAVIFIVTLFIGFFIIQIEGEVSFGRVFINVIFSMSIFGLLAYLFGMNHSEKANVHDFIIKFKCKMKSRS